jgi:hypothetical protein
MGLSLNLVDPLVLWKTVSIAVILLLTSTCHFLIAVGVVSGIIRRLIVKLFYNSSSGGFIL